LNAKYALLTFVFASVAAFFASSTFVFSIVNKLNYLSSAAYNAAIKAA
jgi:hypothetical protein